jgi:hypothetical protein
MRLQGDHGDPEAVRRTYRRRPHAGAVWSYAADGVVEVSARPPTAHRYRSSGMVVPLVDWVAVGLTGAYTQALIWSSVSWSADRQIPGSRAGR